MDRHMPNDAQLDAIIDSVRAYGEIVGHADVQDLEFQITRAFSAASQLEPDFYNCAAILPASLRAREKAPRMAAWFAQHIFGRRAFCVSNFLFQAQGDRYFSPVVNQLRHLGIKPREVPWSSFLNAAKPKAPYKQIDAVLVDPLGGQATLIKAAPYSLTRVPAPRQGTLFGGESSQANLTERSRLVDSRLLASLVLGQMILRSAFPHLAVRSVVLLLDPDNDSLHFQAFDVSSYVLKQLEASFSPVDASLTIASSHSLVSAGRDLDDLFGLAKLPTSDRLNRLPVDRSARANMFLHRMWELQESSNGLRPFRAVEVRDSVESNHLIEYTNDLLRHDVEDCLERQGFIERLRYGRRQYALTAGGVFQVLLMRSLLAAPGQLSSLSDPVQALQLVTRQAKLVAKYRAGKNVISE